MDENITSKPGSMPPLWLEVFSRHQSNLNAHLEICGMVQQHVPCDQDSVKALSSMIHATQQLVRDLEKLRAEFFLRNIPSKMASDSNPNESHAHQKTAPTSTGNGPVHTNIRNEDSNVPTFDQDPTSKQIPHQSKSGKKRSRNENEQENDDQSIHEPSSNKKRKKPSIKSRNSDMQETNVTQKAPYVPVIEVEDISHEVEARLKLKEAARQNRMGRRERKRKRDSAGSVTCDATAAGNMVPKHKKSKTGSCSERNGDIEGLESRGKNKPQGKGRIMDMDDVKQGNTEKRVKR